MAPRQRTLIVSAARLVRDVLAFDGTPQADANAATVRAFAAQLDGLARAAAGAGPRPPTEPFGPHVAAVFSILAAAGGIDFEDPREAESIVQVVKGALAVPAAAPKAALKGVTS